MTLPFYHIRFSDVNVTIQCIDRNGKIVAQSMNRWKIKNGHTIELQDSFDDFLFPRFGDIHRKLFSPWVIKIETQINGEYEFEQWNFSKRLEYL